MSPFGVLTLGARYRGMLKKKANVVLKSGDSFVV